MFFRGRDRLREIKALLVFLCLFLTFVQVASAISSRAYTQKRFRRPRVSKGGNYGTQNEPLYKGSSPCKVGPGIPHAIESKFCGFYDQKEAAEKEGQ